MAVNRAKCNPNGIKIAVYLNIAKLAQQLGALLLDLHLWYINTDELHLFGHHVSQFKHFQMLFLLLVWILHF